MPSAGREAQGFKLIESHSRAGGNPAAMRIVILDSRLLGNDGRKIGHQIPD
jgi:hypothetical protein